jgi:hypothetical protein
MAPDENAPMICTPTAVAASSKLDVATPQGGEGASSTRAWIRALRAASWATSPPMEWPSRIGGSACSAQSLAISAA